VSHDLNRDELVAALRGYLEELQESGVHELPLSAETPPAPRLEPASATAPAPAPAQPASQPTECPAGPDAASETLADIRAALGDCHRCALGTSRTNLVFGVGNPRARLLFVGEAPGRDEDLKGEPFVGEAGQLLTKIIQAMGFARDEVYICNVLKCRPPGNRNPDPAEIEQCQPFLLRQIQAIGPVAIVALGTFSAHTLLQTREPISKLRGHFHDYHGIPLMPTFHPAFLLRNPAMKREVWDDMQQVMRRLGQQPSETKRGA
jgi:DNA polymerase